MSRDRDVETLEEFITRGVKFKHFLRDFGL